MVSSLDDKVTEHLSLTHRHYSINHAAHAIHLSGYGEDFPTYTRAIDRRDVKKEGRWDGYFPDRKNVFVIERRFQIGEAFTVFNRFYGHKVTLKALYSLPLSKFDGANLKVLIDSKLGLPITKIEHFVALKTFDTTVCKAVGMARGSTVLCSRPSPTPVNSRSISKNFSFRKTNATWICQVLILKL